MLLVAVTSMQVVASADGRSDVATRSLFNQILESNKHSIASMHTYKFLRGGRSLSSASAPGEFPTSSDGGAAGGETHEVVVSVIAFRCREAQILSVVLVGIFVRCFLWLFLEHSADEEEEEKEQQQHLAVECQAIHEQQQKQQNVQLQLQQHVPAKTDTVTEHAPVVIVGSA